MIVDNISLHLKAGNGGDGCLSFSRKRNYLVGNGGRGGKGADIIFRVNGNLYDLSKFKYKKKFIGQNGSNGASSNKKGKDVPALILEVPLGTFIKNFKGDTLADLNQPEQFFLAARGGKGGEGNYKRSESQKGQPGQEKHFVLDYRIPCDVSIVGFPNVGRTTLFNRLSGEKHKVAAYPFTTLHNSWAVCEYQNRSFVLLDTPPIKEKAELSKEESFLKHLHRAKVVLIVSDNFDKCRSHIKIIRDKIINFDESYREKKKFYLLNKIDKIDEGLKIKNFLAVSAKDGKSMDILKEKIIKTLS